LGVDFFQHKDSKTQRIFGQDYGITRQDFSPLRTRRDMKKFWTLVTQLSRRLKISRINAEKFCDRWTQINTDLEAEKLKCKT
jgi:hypothetical protein